MRFRYTALTPEGRSLEGEMDASDAGGVAASLGGRGLLLVSAARVGGREGGVLAARIDPRKVTALLGELALMLRSGLPLDEALGLVAPGLPARLARVVADLRAEVLAGASFVQVLERHPTVFSADIVAMARIAEATGDLHGVLAAVVVQRERAQKLAETLSGALRYPAFLLISATGVLAFFLIQVIPQFAGLFADAGRDPGVLVRVILALSDALVANETGVAAGLAALLGLGLLVRRIPAAWGAVASVLLRLPVVGGTWRLWRTTRLLNGLAVLLTQGVPLTEALKVLDDVVGVTGRADLAAVRDAVRRGGRLHEALGTVNLVPPVAVRMLRIGEETGELAKIATDAGALYALQLERRFDRLSAIVGPAAILLIAGLIGGLMVTIMSALVSVDQAVF